MPRVARSAPCEMTGKIPAAFHSGSIDDQSQYEVTSVPSAVGSSR